MRILLDSDDLTIDSIVSRCCERVGIELKKVDNNPTDCDLLIKDCNLNTEISDINIYKTLCLLPKNFERIDELKFCITKPFLPSELIKFLSEFGDSSEDGPCNILDVNPSKQTHLFESKKNINKDITPDIEDNKYDFIEGIDNLLDGFNNFFNTPLAQESDLDTIDSKNTFDFKLVPVMRYKESDEYIELKKQLKEFLLNEIKKLDKSELIKDININIVVNKEKN